MAILHNIRYTTMLSNNRLFYATDNDLEKLPVKSMVPVGIPKRYAMYLKFTCQEDSKYVNICKSK